jgi:hypothetical protein
MNDPSKQPQSNPKRGLFSRVFRKKSTPQEPETVALPPGMLMVPPSVAAILGLPHVAPAPAPADSAPTSREWTPMFADEINVGDLVGTPAGMLGGTARELRVCNVREHTGAPEDLLRPYLTLLMVDTTSNEVFSPTVSVHQGFRVAPAVPDSPAVLSGGA